MAKLDDAQRRSAVIAERIQQRTELALRRFIANFEGEELVSEVVPKALTSFVQNDIGCLTASLIVVCRSIFRYCYACRRTILPQTGARRLLRQAQK